ncbi:hypothetical protein HK102_001074, partial [Quaeritorhiza haematococci]
MPDFGGLDGEEGEEERTGLAATAAEYQYHTEGGVGEDGNADGEPIIQDEDDDEARALLAEEEEEEQEEEEDDDELDSDENLDEPHGVKEMQQAINSSRPFGLKIWKPALYKKNRSIEAKTYEALHSSPGALPNRALYYNVGNILWCVVFGWWIAGVYLAVAVLFLGPFAVVGRVGGLLLCSACVKRVGGSVHDGISCGSGPIVWLRAIFADLADAWAYAQVLINLAGYMFWPFGKFIAKRSVYHVVFQSEVMMADESTPLLNNNNNNHNITNDAAHPQQSYHTIVDMTVGAPADGGESSYQRGEVPYKSQHQPSVQTQQGRGGGADEDDDTDDDPDSFS